MNLQAYNDLVVEHALSGFARFVESTDTLQGTPWSCDMVEGVVVFGGERRVRIHILGTFWAGDQTFLWSWANPGAAEWSSEALAFARSLAERAEREPGLDVFRERKVATAEVPFMELCSVCSELSGGLPLYVGGQGDRGVLLLLEGAPDEQPGLEKLPRVLLDFQLNTRSDVRASAERYLERRGFVVSRAGQSSEARRPAGSGSSFTLRWDEQGRLAGIDSHLVKE